jgi:hypothetical protein
MSLGTIDGNKCDREYTGCPKIVYENPNEELGEGIILIGNTKRS